jgi:hypothetical protein
MARHPVAVPTKQRPPGNNRGPEASDDEGRKKRCTVPSPQREAVSASEQALRDYEDYLFYYGLKEYCTQYSEYVDSAEDRHFVDTTSAEEAVETASDDDEPIEALQQEAGDNDAPNDDTASAISDAPIAAEEDNGLCESFSATQTKESARDTSDKPEDESPASAESEASWAWALDSVGHVRGPSTSSSCTAESVGTASRASSWAEVHTPLPRRKCAGSDNEWEVVSNDEDAPSSLLCKIGS